jgi:hypothetical protein
MLPIPHWLLGCLAALGAVAPVRAVTLLGEFPLNGTLTNNVPGGPSLVLLPYAGNSGSLTSNSYVFGKNQGLTFTSPSLSATSYSVEFSFKSNLDSTATWSKLLDISGVGANDNGLYIHNSSGQRLQFYPQADGSQADFISSTTIVDVALTRDGTTGTVTGYVNGQQRFSFTDGSSLAVITAPGNRLTFFVDDTATGQSEISGGTLYYARIYDGALTAAQVAALFAAGAPSAIPEPAMSAGVLAGGALLIGLRWRRPRRTTS